LNPSLSHQTVAHRRRNLLRHSVVSDAAARDIVSAQDRANAAIQAERDEGSHSNNQHAAANDNTIINRMALGGRPFPLSMIVGQNNIKQALLLAAVNYRMGMF
jgi:hypothetical protein